MSLRQRPQPAVDVESGWWPWLPPRWAVLMYQTLTARLIRIEETMMGTQQDVDRITVDLTRIGREIRAEIAVLDAEVSALELQIREAGVPIDTSGLRDAVSALDLIAPPLETPTVEPLEPLGPEPS